MIILSAATKDILETGMIGASVSLIGMIGARGGLSKILENFVDFFLGRPN